MKREVGWPVVLLTLVLLGAVLFGAYRMVSNAYAPPAHPGAEDIPPKTAADSVPVTPPPDAGPVPKTMPR